MLVSHNDIQEMIQTIKDRIIERFQPERIILFGSHARGDAGSDSDVDILVVIDMKGSKREKAIEIGSLLHDIPVAKDIIVSTSEEYEWRKDVTGTIEYPASHDGVILYAKP
ncbi:MAG: nucleotidyltransferase domain-containing protein [Candidatus Latescibacter sp.]|nr:nucleotidyltransferase domain-containing protein [Candidatus Latescibacter sp.]